MSPKYPTRFKGIKINKVAIKFSFQSPVSHATVIAAELVVV